MRIPPNIPLNIQKLMLDKAMGKLGVYGDPASKTVSYTNVPPAFTPNQLQIGERGEKLPNALIRRDLNGKLDVDYVARKVIEILQHIWTVTQGGDNFTIPITNQEIALVKLAIPQLRTSGEPPKLDYLQCKISKEERNKIEEKVNNMLNDLERYATVNSSRNLV